MMDLDATELSKKLKALDARGVESGCGCTRVPNRNAIVKTVKEIQRLCFRGYFTVDPETDRWSDEELIGDIYNSLKEEIASAVCFCNAGKTPEEQIDAAKASAEFMASLPEIKRLLLLDMEALFDGDPAANCREEVLICYPGFYATSMYRIAHVLYECRVPLIPRIITEYAHAKTGIDIHAGAKIGEYFFIDHGTGIVIGETTTIGNHVKLYQGVTLGAKSFELDENGNPVKGIKRHPDIGNDVIIYANATILGGLTKIGDGSVIGGNVWLTSSVPAGSKISYNYADKR